MSQESSSKPQETVSKTVVIILGAATGLFFLLMIIFLALFAGSGSSKELEGANKEISMKKEEINTLNKTVTDYSKTVNDLTIKLDSEKANNTALSKQVVDLTKNLSIQAAELASLQKMYSYLWIGSASSAALGAGGVGFGIYELIRANNLSTTLTTYVGKANHYQTYFDRSNFWLLEDYILYYQADLVFWDFVYDSSSDGWKRDDIVKRVKNRINTVTFIMTDKGWLIAGVLTKELKEDGSFTEDDQAFLMTLNRVYETIIPSWDPNIYSKAARLNMTGLIEFGEGEILINNNATGMAMADTTYYRYSDTIPAAEFYAGEPKFTVRWVQVFQYEIYRRPTGAPLRQRLASHLPSALRRP